jgi:hypothetical protein
MQNVKTIYKKSVRQYKENISVLQSINIIYITIIFLLFVTGIYLLGIWALGLGLLFLPMFSVAFNFISLKLHRNEEIRTRDIFIANKFIIPTFFQYYQVYKKPILWSVLGFFVSTIICSSIYIGIIGIDNIISMIDANGELLIDELLNSDSYLKFAVISQVVSVIVGYFVFTLTRQRYQFIPLMMQNGSFRYEKIEKVAKSVFNEIKKPVRLANMKLLLFWIAGLLVGGVSLYIFDSYNVFNFDVSLLLSIFIFLFIGSFSISIKVIFKNNLFYEYILPGMEMAKEKIYQKQQE